MQIQTTTQWDSSTACDWAVVFVQSGSTLRLPATVPADLKAALEKLHTTGDLPTGAAEYRKFYGIDAAGISRVLVVSFGDQSLSSHPPEDQYRLFHTTARALTDKSGQQVVWFLPSGVIGSNSLASTLPTIATTLTMAGQSQAIYQQEPKRYDYELVTLVTDVSNAEAAIEQGIAIGQAINLTREMINRAAHEVNPIHFAERAGQMASQHGLTCRIFDQPQLEAERMNSMLAVAKGSDNEPRMVMLEHHGAGDAPFIGLVGKGVTYDSGGYSIKPSDGMKTMKSDMSGAATVLGVMQAIAALKLPVNVRGYMGLVENMISGNAYRLGDILTARNGVTIEVMNTDAEGRLVLADVLCYAVDSGCEKLIDLATLTGSCVVALGEEYTGMFTNSQQWCDQLSAATAQAGEKSWQMPMHDSFSEQLKSDVADCKNIGTRWGGSITAAKFLEKFVAGTPWIHLDIAGPAFLTDSKSYREGGASGVMVRSLLTLLESQP